jgi:AcrR family transcriptional regulator
VQAAAQAFAEHGVEASLEDVARRADVGIGTLYRHFPTRDSLVLAAYRHEVDVLCESADELLASLPPDEALAAWMQRFVGYVATKRGMASALKTMMGTDAALFDDCRRQMNDAATRLLDAASATGGIFCGRWAGSASRPTGPTGPTRLDRSSASLSTGCATGRPQRAEA